MCIDITEEDFITVHHELGHNFYQRAYDKQPFLFRDSANDGFHEAIGDTIALSVTPEYLVKIGLLPKGSGRIEGYRPAAGAGAGEDRVSAVRADDRPVALESIFGRDSARTIQQRLVGSALEVSGGRAARWRAARRISIRARSITSPANVPYTRYFLSYIMQFQFHRALAKAAGCPAAGSDTPLHRCSIYDNKEAGAKLNAMLEMGVSKPWQDAMFELTGQRNMDATAILDYFAPLKKWLDEQNKGKPVGW